MAYLPIKDESEVYKGTDNNSVITPKILSRILSTNSIDIPNIDDYVTNIEININKTIYLNYIINGKYNSIYLPSGNLLNDYNILINQEFLFKMSSSASNCTIYSTNNETIDNKLSITLPSPNSAIKLLWNGYQWNVSSSTSGGSNSDGSIKSINNKIYPDDDGNVDLSLDDFVGDSGSINISKPLISSNRISVIRK